MTKINGDISENHISEQLIIYFKTASGTNLVTSPLFLIISLTILDEINIILLTTIDIIFIFIRSSPFYFFLPIRRRKKE